MKKNCALICFIILLLEYCPILISSWSRYVIFVKPYTFHCVPLTFLKYSDHSISGMNMSAVNSADSVKLLVFIVTFGLVSCFFDTAPSPGVSIAPSCPIQFLVW